MVAARTGTSVLNRQSAQLQASERRYRLVTENSPDLVWTVDMEGKIDFVNASSLGIRGVTPDEELSTPWFERMPPEYAARVAAKIQEELAIHRAGGPLDRTPQVAPAYHKDGELLWTETIASPLFDDDGKPVGICATTRDITARHQVEEALRRSEERLAKIFRSNPGGIAIARQSDGGFIDANQAFLNMIGYTRDQILGRTPAELGLVTPDVRLPVRSAALEQEFIRGLDLQITSAEGRVIDPHLLPRGAGEEDRCPPR